MHTECYKSHWICSQHTELRCTGNPTKFSPSPLSCASAGSLGIVAMKSGGTDCSTSHPATQWVMREGPTASSEAMDTPPPWVADKEARYGGKRRGEGGRKMGGKGEGGERREGGREEERRGERRGGE